MNEDHAKHLRRYHDLRYVAGLRRLTDDEQAEWSALERTIAQLAAELGIEPQELERRSLEEITDAFRVALGHGPQVQPRERPKPRLAHGARTRAEDRDEDRSSTDPADAEDEQEPNR